MVLNLEQIARALGGEISGNQVLAPGPGHIGGSLHRVRLSRPASSGRRYAMSYRGVMSCDTLYKLSRGRFGTTDVACPICGPRQHEFVEEPVIWTLHEDERGGSSRPGGEKWAGRLLAMFGDQDGWQAMSELWLHAQTPRRIHGRPRWGAPAPRSQRQAPPQPLQRRSETRLPPHVCYGS